MDKIRVIKEYVQKRFPKFGPNKHQEVVRLLFEIAKREGCDPLSIIGDIPEGMRTFFYVRTKLLKRRFPHYRAGAFDVNFSFPEVRIDPTCRVSIEEELTLDPKSVFIEESVARSVLVSSFKRRYPLAQYQTIPSYREYVRNRKTNIQDYNVRRDTFFLVKEDSDFFRKCPCSPQTVSCGYHLVNLGVGCPFECTYCCLQGYINSPGIVLPANLDDFFERFENLPKAVRLGSGELTDSLVFDDITEFSRPIIDFFRKHPQTIFEFKTKSDRVKTILKTQPSENIVITWSVNPQSIIDITEFYAASFDKRMDAAKRCVSAGYHVGFHFDPIIPFEGWETSYREVVNQIFDGIDADRIAWISLGILRMTQRMKRVIENRFPESPILNGEMIPSYDDKLRYPFNIRLDMYQKMRHWMRERSPKARIYLCMEEKEMWEAWQCASFQNGWQDDLHLLCGSA